MLFFGYSPFRPICSATSSTAAASSTPADRHRLALDDPDFAVTEHHAMFLLPDRLRLREGGDDGSIFSWEPGAARGSASCRGRASVRWFETDPHVFIR
jgi:hypothetical protein